MFHEQKFYTKDHEWLCFSMGCAYMGVSAFKLTGIRKIEHIGLSGFKSGDFIPQQMPMLHLSYRDYVIPVHAPIACTLLETNPVVTEGDWHRIITCPESEGWLFKILPENTGKSHLVTEQDYQLRFGSKYITQD